MANETKISDHIAVEDLNATTSTQTGKSNVTRTSSKGNEYALTHEQVERENERLRAKAYSDEQEMKRLRYQLEEAQAEKKKPGLTVVNQEGKQERRKRENTTGLSDMILPPFTKNRVAIYRICGTDGINPATNLPVEPFDTLIPGQYTLYDRFDPNPAARNKFRENIVSTRPVTRDGQVHMENLVEDILFTRGWLQVPVETKYNLYIFLELHSNNKSNPHRPKNAPMIFERVDINTKSASVIGASLDLGLDAANEVTRMNKEDVLSYAASVPTISTATGRPIHEIRTDLKRWALNHPNQYFRLNKNAKATIQMNIIEAEQLGLIGYRPDSKGYVYQETEEVFCIHTPSEEPMEKLVKFMGTTEGKVWYDLILDRMNYWSNE